MRRIFRSIRASAYIAASGSAGLACGYFQGRLAAEVEATTRGFLVDPTLYGRQRRRYLRARSLLRKIIQHHQKCADEEAEAMVQSLGFSQSGERVEPKIH